MRTKPSSPVVIAGRLAKVDQTAAKALNALLGLKAAAEYQHAPTSSANARRAERAMRTLLEAAIRSG